jgi:hypothetical protein
MKSVAIKLSLVISMLVMGAGAADAKPYKSKAGQVEVTIPDAWKTDGKKDVLLTAVDPKQEVALVFMVVEKADVDAALKELEKEVGPMLKDQKWGKPKELELNGMKGMAIDGTAKVQGKAAEISVVILKTPNKMGLILFGAVEASKRKAHEPELIEIMKSLKPTK